MKRSKWVFVGMGIAFCVGVGIIAFLGCIWFFSLPAYYDYTGERQDLYREALESLFECHGWHYTMPMPLVEVIEEDAYGRTLFGYYESNEGGLSLLIAQKSDEEYVYYYPDFNFITVSHESVAHPNGSYDANCDWNLLLNAEYNLKHGGEKRTIRDFLGDFGEEAIARLKAWNDWQQPIDESKMVKLEIVFSGSRPSFDKETVQKAYERLVPPSPKYKGTTTYRYGNCIANDDFGRKLILANGVSETEDGKYGDWIAVLIFLDENGVCPETGVMLWEEKYSYQQILHDFKTLHDWNEAV